MLPAWRPILQSSCAPFLLHLKWLWEGKEKGQGTQSTFSSPRAVCERRDRTESGRERGSKQPAPEGRSGSVPVRAGGLLSQQVGQGGTGRGGNKAGAGAELALRMLPWRWPWQSRARCEKGLERAPLGYCWTEELAPLNPSTGLCSSSRRLQEGPQPELGQGHSPAGGAGGRDP